jgi:hypothetical protein
VGSLKQTADGRRIALGSRCLVGRDGKCDIRPTDKRVSGLHASVEWVGNHWELRDRGSRNGTFVDGRRLVGGESAVLTTGSTFTLGGAEAFCLEDASPPVASARHARSGLLRTAAEGLLVLPDDDHPEVSIFEDPGGAWVAEEGDQMRRVADRDIVVADGEGWVLDLPNHAVATLEVSALPPTLETITLRFGVSRDEEFTEVTIAHEGGSTLLPTRSHHYLLVTLARAMIDDQAASSAERGWVDREVLCRMLATDPRRLNVDVFRVRRQIAELGIHGAAGIIARRPGTGQLRLGTHRVEVNKL